MPTKEDKAKYDMQYAKTKLKRIPLDVQKEKYEEIKSAAERSGESVNGYIKKAIDERMGRDCGIVTIKKGTYIANRDKLFDAYHCLNPNQTGSTTISDIASVSLDCFIRNALPSTD